MFHSSKDTVKFRYRDHTIVRTVQQVYDVGSKHIINSIRPHVQYQFALLIIIILVTKLYRTPKTMCSFIHV